jgi:hypothetical protein
MRFECYRLTVFEYRTRLLDQLAPLRVTRSTLATLSQGKQKEGKAKEGGDSTLT